MLRFAPGNAQTLSHPQALGARQMIDGLQAFLRNVAMTGDGAKGVARANAIVRIAQIR